MSFFFMNCRNGSGNAAIVFIPVLNNLYKILFVKICWVIWLVELRSEIYFNEQNPLILIAKFYLTKRDVKVFVTKCQDIVLLSKYI